MKMTASTAGVLVAAGALAAGFAAVRAHAAAKAEVNHAVAVLHAGAGGKVTGTIHFHKRPNGMHVQGTVSGLSAGAHGFHVHEFGDCSAADFTSAGGHFNPTQEPHAAPDAAKRHEGDMGNIQAGADGTAKVDYMDGRLDFEGDDSILGRGVIVHEKADDLKTQPTGDAGGRLACGVIGVAKPE
ncbi:MAG TPA: superoxide dismutase family protein [Vicinamibacteria bacterium]|nr:superoxide dismutase family protein [Vicinamibacteria bacterium]